MKYFWGSVLHLGIDLVWVRMAVFIFRLLLIGNSQPKYCLVIRAFAQAHRVVHGRSSVETGLKEALYERNHKLDRFFEIWTLPLKSSVERRRRRARSK